MEKRSYIPEVEGPKITAGDLNIASKVLIKLLGSTLEPGATAADILEMLFKLSNDATPGGNEPLKTGQGSWDNTVKTLLAARPPRTLPGNDALSRCYICPLDIDTRHTSSRSMCIPCGDFNLAGSDLTSPGRLDLSGKTALVTGVVHHTRQIIAT